MPNLEKIQTKIFADGANKDSMLDLYKEPHIKGFTTNPTLMRAAGVEDYEKFCIDILQSINDRPISFEVFSDDFDDMERQAKKIASWGDNVYVKIPVTNSKGESAVPLIENLVAHEIKLNVTALFTIPQVEKVAAALHPAIPSYISVFAGRIADTGRDPLETMIASLEIIKTKPSCELIWASPREVLNVYQAASIGCHIITATPEILKKLKFMDHDLDEFSLETVKMFLNDSRAAGFYL